MLAHQCLYILFTIKNMQFPIKEVNQASHPSSAMLGPCWWPAGGLLLAYYADQRLALAYC